MRKKIVSITLIYIVFFLSIAKCYAAGSHINVPQFSSSQVESNGETETPSNTETWTVHKTDGSEVLYTCTYEYSIKTKYNSSIYGYNQENKSIINGRINPQEEILAGTAIGINIIETTVIEGEIGNIKLTSTTSSYTTQRTPYNCTKSKKVCNGGRFDVLASMLNFKVNFLLIQTPCTFQQVSCTYNGTDCTNCKWTTTTAKTTGDPVSVGTNTAEYEQCKQKSEQFLKDTMSKISVGPSYEVKLEDSNDIQKNGISKTLNGEGGCYGTNPKTCTYKYGIKTACVNVLTAQVSYPDSGICSSEEIEVKNDSNDGHWHYFIPLNAKSNSVFTISLSRKSESGLQDKNFCKNLINNNSNYIDFIRDKNYEKLTGNKAMDLQKVNSGCYLGVEIEIPIKQAFYNEVTDDQGNITFKGFNFYYKPIDITNPFPNGTTSTSIWNAWNGTNPNISESYQNWTYIADVSNTSAIRAYTSEHPYTSWSNMYTTGRSSFIEMEGIITRNTGVTNSFYKLGCGPSNADWSDCK